MPRSRFGDLPRNLKTTGLRFLLHFGLKRGLPVVQFAHGGGNRPGLCIGAVRDFRNHPVPDGRYPHSGDDLPLHCHCPFGVECAGAGGDWLGSGGRGKCGCLGHYIHPRSLVGHSALGHEGGDL